MIDKYTFNAEELANRLYALLCAVHDVEDTNRVGDDDEHPPHLACHGAQRLARLGGFL
jgi:hypothetical protein